MKDVMTRMSFIKYIYFLRYNFKRLIVLNFITIVPLGMLVIGLANMLPSIVDYFNSMNMAILQIEPKYSKAIFVVVAKGKDENSNLADLYMFKPDDFNSLRRYFFIEPYDSEKIDILRERAIGTATVTFFGEPITVKTKEGKPIATIWLSKVSRGTVEIMNYHTRKEWSQKNFTIYTAIFLSGLILIGGMLGGISEYVQRMVYHEERRVLYIFRAIKTHFVKSLVISIFLFIIFAAVAANIYFYIFLFSNDVSVFVAALNLWMLIFFIFILLWIFPLMVINSNESIWRLMRKSLFLAFDNFDYTTDVLLILISLFFITIFTAGFLPGISGLFAFLSNALKEISARYSKLDNA